MRPHQARRAARDLLQVERSLTFHRVTVRKFPDLFGGMFRRDHGNILVAKKPRLLDDEPPLYRRMAIQEKRVAARRAALHQRIEERRKQRQELRKENLELQRENRQFARELRQENMAEKKAAREAAGDSHPNMDKGEKAERRAKMLEKRERLMNKGEER